MPTPEELLYPTRKERFEDRRKEGQQRKLSDEFFDHATLIAISRLITQGQFDSIDYPISTGKEGGVFRASGSEGHRAVKVYRIGNAIFRRLPPAVLDELRREVNVANHARLIYAWTRREHTILRRMKAADVQVPQPYGYLRNVLVMEFVGSGGLACPRLKDAVIDDIDAFTADFVLQVRRMVHEAKMVHGDLSEYNVLLRDDRAVLIDVAQAIPVSHPEAKGLLERDLAHFARYLSRHGGSATPNGLIESVGWVAPEPSEGPE